MLYKARYHAYVSVIVWIFLFVPICVANQYLPEDYNCITLFENGFINWTSGKITAVGKASPEDNRGFSHESVPGAARADANRKIIDILKLIKIDNSLTVGEYASKNDAILAGMEKTARDAVIVKQYYTSALEVEIIIEISMFGGFLQLVLPEEILQIPKINPIKKQETEKNSHTGLIIDAGGIAFEPVLNPVIVSEQGHYIYSSAFISREFAVQNGVCRYFCCIKKALNDNRIGNNPLVLKGLRKQETPKTAIVVSMPDYRLLEKATERHTFLKECRVIIVTDQ